MFYRMMYLYLRVFSVQTYIFNNVLIAFIEIVTFLMTQSWFQN